MPDAKSTGMPPNARTAAAERSMPGGEPEERRIADRWEKRRRLCERSWRGLKPAERRLPARCVSGRGWRLSGQRVDIGRLSDPTRSPSDVRRVIRVPGQVVANGIGSQAVLVSFSYLVCSCSSVSAWFGSGDDAVHRTDFDARGIEVTHALGAAARIDLVDLFAPDRWLRSGIRAHTRRS